MRFPFFGDPRRRSLERLRREMARLQEQIADLETTIRRAAEEAGETFESHQVVMRIRGSVIGQDLAAKQAELEKVAAQAREVEASLPPEERPPPEPRPPARRGLVLAAAGIVVAAAAVVIVSVSGPLGPQQAPELAPGPTVLPSATPEPVVVLPTPPRPEPTPVPEPTPSPPEEEVVEEPEPTPETPPDRVIGPGSVRTPGFTGANLHMNPSVSATIIRTVPNGTPVEILEGSARADGFSWLRLRTPAGEVGWMISGAVV